MKLKDNLPADLDSDWNAIKCSCGGYCERVDCTSEELEAFNCGASYECCARAFECGICKKRCHGSAPAPEMDEDYDYNY